MSRRIYRYPHPQHGALEVAAGWDRRLQGFFLTIEHLDLKPQTGEEEGTAHLFSNLDSESFPAHLPVTNKEMITFTVLTLTLEHFQIPTPRGFLEDIQSDQKSNIGSFDKLYALEG